jgi:3D (Asp-Asp-Asp) domain-containing protein
VVQQLALVVACALVAGCKARAVPRDAPPAPPAGSLRGTFALTYYWVSREAPGRADTKVFDASCAVLATTSQAFADELARAGTGQLVDGRTLTVAGECACPRSPCFRVLASEHTWGVGADNRPLVPFRSLAVDRAVIPIGTHLWIEELAEVTLPRTFPDVHDGCVVADDVGGGIAGAEVDWFVGEKLYYQELDAELHLTQVSVRDGGERCR